MPERQTRVRGSAEIPANKTHDPVTGSHCQTVKQRAADGGRTLSNDGSEQCETERALHSQSAGVLVETNLMQSNDSLPDLGNTETS